MLLNYAGSSCIVSSLFFGKNKLLFIRCYISPQSYDPLSFRVGLLRYSVLPVLLYMVVEHITFLAHHLHHRLAFYIERIVNF